MRELEPKVREANDPASTVFIPLTHGNFMRNTAIRVTEADGVLVVGVSMRSGVMLTFVAAGVVAAMAWLFVTFASTASIWILIVACFASVGWWTVYTASLIAERRAGPYLVIDREAKTLAVDRLNKKFLEVDVKENLIYDVTVSRSSGDVRQTEHFSMIGIAIDCSFGPYVVVLPLRANRGAAERILAKIVAGRPRIVAVRALSTRLLAFPTGDS